MRRDIEFEGHGGVVLRGWFYRPAESGARPLAAVVMVHGLSAVKEMALDRYAEVFCEAGLAVLVYDHRGFGASDGEPRQVINPWAQARDLRLAIGWLCEQSEVDPERIGVWGSSYGGGVAIVVAACDERVAAVVANVPLVGYPGVDYSDTTPRFKAIRAEVDDASGASLADVGQSVLGPAAVVRDEVRDGADETNGATAGLVFLDQPESSEWFCGWGADASRWKNRVTLENAAGTEPAWDPGVCIAHVAPCPVMLVVASEDRLAETDIARAAFDRAGEPKAWALIEGHHFTPYSGEAFVRASGAARDFFSRHLG